MFTAIQARGDSSSPVESESMECDTDRGACGGGPSETSKAAPARLPISRDVSGAYCSMAEIYMTDAW